MAERLIITGEILRELEIESHIMRISMLEESDIDRELEAESMNDLELFE